MGSNFLSETSVYSSTYCPYHNLHPFNPKHLIILYALDTEGLSGWAGDKTLEKFMLGTNLTHQATITETLLLQAWQLEFSFNISCTYLKTNHHNVFSMNFHQD